MVRNSHNTLGGTCGAVGIAALAAIRRARGAVRAGVAAVVPGRAERSAETQVQLLPTVTLAPRAAAAARAGAAAGARAHGSGGGWEFGAADVWRAMLSEPLPGTLAILLLLT